MDETIANSFQREGSKVSWDKLGVNLGTKLSLAHLSQFWIP